MLDVNQTVKLSAITTTLKRFATKAVSNAEKNYLYEVVEGLGTAINTGPSHQGFSMPEFEKECGIGPEWAKAA